MHTSASSEKGENSEFEDLSSYYYVTDTKTSQNSPAKSQSHLQKGRTSEAKILGKDEEHFRGEDQEHPEDDCNETLQLGDGLVAGKEDNPSTERNTPSPSQEYSFSLKKFDLKCRIIRDHSLQCHCSTPRLHVYLLNSHHCDSSCYAKEDKDIVMSVTSDPQKSASESQQERLSSEILETNVTDTDLANIIKEEQITMRGDCSKLSSLCESVKDDAYTSRLPKKSDKKIKKRSLLKIRESLFKLKKNNVSRPFKSKINGLKCFPKQNARFREPKALSKGSTIILRDAKNKLKKIPSLIKRKRHFLQNCSEGSTAPIVIRCEGNPRSLLVRKNLIRNRVHHVQVNSSKSPNTDKKTGSCVEENGINLPILEDEFPNVGSDVKENCKNLLISADKTKKTISQVQEIPSESAVIKICRPTRKISAPQAQGITRNASLQNDFNKISATHLKEISRNLPVNKDSSNKKLTLVLKNPKNFPVSEGPYIKTIVHTQENSKDISMIKSPIKKKSIHARENIANDSNSTPENEDSVKRLRVQKTSRNLPVTGKRLAKKLDVNLPKKSKKLFQINKGGVFHSFSQNLIRISSVASLTSSEEAKTSTERELEKKAPVVNNNRLKDTEISNLIPPLKLNVVVKSPPSDDEDKPSLMSVKDETSLLPSPPLQLSAKDDTMLQAANVSATGLECLTTKIKSEPYSLLNVKSETIIEECLNLTMEEDDKPKHKDSTKLHSFNLEEKKSNSVWVSVPEKYPHFDGEGEMRCTLCLTPFPDFISLVDHLEKHQRSGFILCYYCQKSFGDKTSMRRHMRTHTGEKPYQCKICEKRFSLPGNFKKHRDIHEDIRTEPCDICGKTFRRKEHLKYHKRTHTGEKPFKCSLCGSCFTARYSLQIHMNIHLGKKPYKCSDCGKAFCDKSTMRKHIRVHTGERPFNCRVCHKSFGESGSLTAHAATHSQDRPFLCTQCHLAFKTSGGLRQHIKTHIGDKQFSCKYCGMMFIQKYNMMMHERIHTGEKPYECSECHRTFRSRSCLGKHVILHGGDAERKYSCDHCDKKFFRKAHLKRHINTHLGIKEYECNFCSKRFSTNGSLKKHLATFHTEGARAFPCIVCGRTFKRSIYVATHKCLPSEIKMESDQ